VLRRLRIAICVNQENDASLLCGIIKKLRPEGEVDVFYIAHEFLATQYNDVKYDIAIIEIEKKEIHGFDIAITMKTRRASTAPHIILYSDTEEYVYEGYKVACRYLRKTDTIAQIEDVLADIMEMCKPKCIFIETSEGAINIAIDAIQFIEAQGNHVTFNLINQSYTVRMTLKAAKMLLPAKRFAFSHRSFIVNLEKIIRIEEKNIKLTGGKSVPISRYRKRAFMDRQKGIAVYE
jgi:Response regulator of the LytR/AlgR family